MALSSDTLPYSKYFGIPPIDGGFDRYGATKNKPIRTVPGLHKFIAVTHRNGIHLDCAGVIWDSQNSIVPMLRRNYCRSGKPPSSYDQCLKTTEITMGELRYQAHAKMVENELTESEISKLKFMNRKALAAYLFDKPDDGTNVHATYPVWENGKITSTGENLEESVKNQSNFVKFFSPQSNNTLTYLEHSPADAGEPSNSRNEEQGEWDGDEMTGIEHATDSLRHVTASPIRYQTRRRGLNQSGGRNTNDDTEIPISPASSTSTTIHQLMPVKKEYTRDMPKVQIIESGKYQTPREHSPLRDGNKTGMRDSWRPDLTPPQAKDFELNKYQTPRGHTPLRDGNTNSRREFTPSETRHAKERRDVRMRTSVSPSKDEWQVQMGTVSSLLTDAISMMDLLKLNVASAPVESTEEEIQNQTTRGNWIACGLATGVITEGDVGSLNKWLENSS